MKFKLLNGRHREMPDRSVPGAVSRIYERGQIVESNHDLVAKHGVEKFQRVADDTPAGGSSVVPPAVPPLPVTPPKTDTTPVSPPATGAAPTASAPPASALPSNLDDMTVAQLKDFAAKEEIDLEGVALKADILSTIRSYYA